MVWNEMKHDLENIYRPKTKRELIKSVKKFWSNHVSIEYCNQKINKLFDGVKKCIIFKGKATGF
jgi:hypothetical protein